MEICFVGDGRVSQLPLLRTVPGAQGIENVSVDDVAVAGNSGHGFAAADTQCTLSNTSYTISDTHSILSDIQYVASDRRSGIYADQCIASDTRYVRKCVESTTKKAATVAAVESVRAIRWSNASVWRLSCVLCVQYWEFQYTLPVCQLSSTVSGGIPSLCGARRLISVEYLPRSATQPGTDAAACVRAAATGRSVQWRPSCRHSCRGLSCTQAAGHTSRTVAATHSIRTASRIIIAAAYQSIRTASRIIITAPSRSIGNPRVSSILRHSPMIPQRFSMHRRCCVHL